MSFATKRQLYYAAKLGGAPPEPNKIQMFSAPVEELNEGRLNEMKVVELRKLAIARELDPSGRKSEVIDRILGGGGDG